MVGKLKLLGDKFIPYYNTVLWYYQQKLLSFHVKAIHEGVKYGCIQCDYTASQWTTLTHHIEIVHMGLRYIYNQGDSTFTKQNSLTTHIILSHEGVKYDYNQCDYKATQKTYYSPFNGNT